MRHFLTLLIGLLTLAALPAQAQQNQIARRSKSIFVLPEFERAEIRQSFGRKAYDTVNIYLKDASLVYRKKGKVMRAYVKNIYGVKFNDSLNYVRVDSAFARIVAQKGYNQLLCKTTVDMAQYREEETGGKGLDFFEVEGFDYFSELNQDVRDSDKGIPLKDTYYFSVKGMVIAANETEFKKVIGKDQQQTFKVLMANRFWSWRDPKCLTQLLDFLPH